MTSKKPAKSKTSHSKTEDFNPNSAAVGDGIFGLPFSEAEAKLVYIPVPWEVTTSYGGGTSLGPKSIHDASAQIDLFDLELGHFWKAGLAMQEIPKNIFQLNQKGKQLAKPIVAAGGEVAGNKKLIAATKSVNEMGAQLNQWVFEQTQKILKNKQIPVVVGGDHSTPFGAFKAVSEKIGNFGILHFDAHSDTRKCFEGFEWSHASIMHNAIEKIPQIEKLVQVGIRDFCEEEYLYIQNSKGRIKTYFDETIQSEKHRGSSWLKICEKIVADLPQKVWISFDIDGLKPQFCPHTGTPVPGGLDYWEAIELIKLVAISGRTIIGFDLNEVAPGPKGDEWDGNVGARLLFKMTGWCLKSQGLI